MRRRRQRHRTRPLARIWWWCNVVTENCGDVVWSNNLAGYMVTCGGNAAITVRFTATDACGHTVTTTATFSVVDTIVPEWNEAVPPELHGGGMWVCSRACGADGDRQLWIQIPVDFNETVGYAACPGNYTITRSWHAGGCLRQLGVTHEQMIQVTDTEAPVIDHSCRRDRAECSDESAFEEVTVEDNCTADPYFEVQVDTLPGSCPNNFVIQRRFVAADDCGNVSQASQFITVVDTTPPAFVEEIPAEELTVECEDLEPADILTAVDNCDAGFVTVNFEEVPVWMVLVKTNSP